MTVHDITDTVITVDARLYASLFGRAFAQVSLVALNVSQIAAGNYATAFLTGCAISWVWFHNARSAAHVELPGAALVYATGAGLGTVTGMLVSRCL